MSTSVTVLSIEKNGEIKEVVIKNYNESELYKKAGFKTGDGFKCYTTWDLELDEKLYSISVFGKTKGRANQENKYEFPPPIDNTLFFGNCIIVNKNHDSPVNINSKEWESIYEYLYGGFEDIGDEDSLEEDDDDESGPRTKAGYLKDGFVVDDDVDDEEDEDEDEDDDNDDDDDDEEEDDDIPKKKIQKRKNLIKSKLNLKKSKKSDKKSEIIKKPLTLFEKLTTVKNDETYLDCTSELSEESYV
jgi:hypothetical protein